MENSQENEIHEHHFLKDKKFLLYKASPQALHELKK